MSDPRAKDNEGAFQVTVTVTPNGEQAGDRATNVQDGSLMPAALYNLMIAEQYIDETKCPAEYKLICFHYGIALLASHRNDRVKRGLASQYLASAAGWEAAQGGDELSKRAIDRIICESHYNLGVIEELDQNYPSARKHYEQALAIARRSEVQEANHLGILDNVAVLAHLGKISCEMQSMFNDRDISHDQRGPVSASKPPDKGPQEISLELIRRVEDTRNEISVLRTLLSDLQARFNAKAFSSQTVVPSRPELPKIGLLSRILQRIASSPAPCRPVERPQTMTPTVTLRKREILDAIYGKLADFESTLTGISPASGSR